MGIKIVNVRVLLIVLILGGALIIVSELMHPTRWNWLTQQTIPAENAERAVAVLDAVTAEGVSGARLVEEKRAVSRSVRAPNVNEF